MEEKLTAFKAAIAAVFTALGAFLGWQGVLVAIWGGCMLLDYLSGTIAAWATGEWSSKVAREGLRHKGGMIFVVAVAGLADIVMRLVLEHIPVSMTWPVLILPLVTAWYILTELGSILENAVKMGAPIPQWLVKLLKTGLKAMNRQGEAILTEQTGPVPETTAPMIVERTDTPDSEP